MPPSGKLKDAEIAALARVDRDGRAMAGRSETQRSRAQQARSIGPSFRRSSRALPAVREYTRGRNRRSTASCLRRWRQRGSSPPPPADKRTLIRRATFDLTGLPPSPEEIRAFLEDHAAGCVRPRGRPAAGLAAVWRAVGTALAGRRPLRRFQRAR